MPDWKEEIKRISSITSREYMTPDKATAIGSLWESLKPKRILEVGTWQGTGACYLGAMAACYGGEVTTVDMPWTAKPNKNFSVVAEDQLAACGITNVTIVRREGGAEAYLKSHFAYFDDPYDFIYIDGGHTWLHASAQYAMAIRAIRVGGWLCFDDLGNAVYPDVDLVWRQLVSPRHKEQYEVGKMGFVMRSPGE